MLSESSCKGVLSAMEPIIKPLVLSKQAPLTARRQRSLADADWQRFSGVEQLSRSPIKPSTMLCGISSPSGHQKSIANRNQSGFNPAAREKEMDGLRLGSQPSIPWSAYQLPQKKTKAAIRPAALVNRYTVLAEHFLECMTRIKCCCRIHRFAGLHSSVIEF
jgi:hypothetical protein